MLTRAFTWLLIVGSLYALGGVRAAAHGAAVSSSNPRSVTQLSSAGLPTPILEARLSAGDPGLLDTFGDAVAVAGGTAVAGAPGHDVGRSGGQDAGAAYLFERDAGGPGSWGEVKKLTAADAQPDDAFGTSVAISGDSIVVGAYLEDGGPGDPRPDSGAAYLFERDAGGVGNWGQVTRLTAGDAQTDDRFGRSVAISGNTIVVGAHLEDGGQGNPLPEAGAAYVFERDAGGPNNWGLVARLTAPNAQSGDFFGTSVAISGNTIVIGANGRADGPGGPLVTAGAAFVFERNQGDPHQWDLVKTLTAADRGALDVFGTSVSVSGRLIVVGAFNEGGGPGDPVPFSGSAYVFERNRSDPTSWSQIAKLAAGDAQTGDQFGIAVAVSGSTIIVGADGEDGGQGDPVPASGSAYLFERNAGGPGTWGQVAKITAPDRQQGDQFGVAVAVSPGRTLLVGAFREDGGPGDPAPFTGAAYLFCPDDDLEPNLNRGGAYPLAPGSYPNLQICGGDSDFYRLTATAGDTLDLSATFIHAEGNLDMALFDSALTQVSVSNSTTNNEVISYPVPTGGIYFLRVAGAGGGEINRYTLTATGFGGSLTYLPLLTTGGP